jgi:5'(3')-deoxyribonucleotidase
VKIWVDCDGVLADFVHEYLSFVLVKFGRKYTHADVTRFAFAECVTSPDEDRQIWETVNAYPGLVRNLRELPGVAALPELRRLGDVGCLTSPTLGPYWMPERAQWLLARGFAKRDIVFASDKSWIDGDVLIDDSLSNCEAWWAARPHRRAILLDAPWNQGETYAERAHGWGDVLRLLGA